MASFDHNDPSGHDSRYRKRLHAMKTFPSLSSAVAIALSMSMAMASHAATPRIDLLGTSAPEAAATRTIAIGPGTRYVNVTGGDIVRFVVGDKVFTWNFLLPIGLSSFELNRVAPAGLLDHTVIAYVAPDPRYMGGGDRSQ